MSDGGEAAAIVQQALSGERRDLQLLAARGVLPLPPAELIPLQVVLAESEDEEVATIASAALRELEPKLVAGVLREGIDNRVVAFLARTFGHPIVVEAILRLRTVDRRILEEMAEHLEPELQEVLLVRQDAIVEEPGILDALERNPELSSYARRRIAEYRQHLLPGKRETAEELTRRSEELTEEEVDEAMQLAAEQPAHGEVDEMTGLSESQIRSLPVPVRLKLSRGAPRTLRGILIKDTNPVVATSVLQYNPMSDAEVEQIAHSRTVVDEVLEAISKNRSWIRKYPVVLALVRNPRTPIGIAVRLTPRLSVRDLRALSRDRNVSNTVRANAQRLYKMKRV